MTLESKVFGHMPDQTPVRAYILRNRQGMTVTLSEYGAAITQIMVADREGRPANVVFGFDTLEGYLSDHPRFGVIVGRVANRIARGRFKLDGREYTLALNHGPHHLHGGLKGFDKKLWSSKPMDANAHEAGVELSCFSPDGDEGYPGNLDVRVTYRLSDENELRIDYRATTDRATLVNLANHSYFNLAGAGDILGHELWLGADHYTPTDERLIPTGEIRSVKGTPVDFTAPTAIGARILETGLEPEGYDHNFVLNNGGSGLAAAARVRDPNSGRMLEVFTTQPGLQFYTANSLDGGITGSGGMKYPRHSGFCLETQHFPDSINHPSFPPVVLRPGETFESATLFKFSAT